MGCGCGTQKPVYGLNTTYTGESNPDCEYTEELLTLWKQKLKCIKDSGYMESLNVTETMMNSYLGIVISSINYKNNHCRFEKSLENIKVLMYKLAEQNLC